MTAKDEGWEREDSFPLCSSVTTVFMISASRALALQRAQRFIVNIPLFEDGEDGLGAETGSCQLAENTPITSPA